MTTISSSERARIPAYDYAAPSEADALAALQRVFGPARGIEVWSRACVDAGLDAGKVTGAAGLGRATEALARQGGAAATVARAITIRMRTFDRLAARAAATGASR
jgi:hypothetical protein